MGDVLPIKGHAAYERQTIRTAAGCLRQVRERLRPTAVLVLGYDDCGEFFIQGVPPSPGEALWLMELARKKLLNPNG